MVEETTLSKWLLENETNIFREVCAWNNLNTVESVQNNDGTFREYLEEYYPTTLENYYLSKYGAQSNGT